MSQKAKSTETSSNTEAGRGQGTSGVGSPITNEAYNVLTALQAKLEGLEAYRKFSKDGSSELWQRLTQTELQTVSSLVDELERLFQEGKFRMHEPGRAKA
jgi:hypothetical protein